MLRSASVGERSSMITRMPMCGCTFARSRRGTVSQSAAKARRSPGSIFPRVSRPCCHSGARMAGSRIGLGALNLQALVQAAVGVVIGWRVLLAAPDLVLLGCPSAEIYLLAAL